MRKLRFVAQIGASLFLRERFFRNRSQFVVCTINRTRRAGFRLRCPSKPQGKGFDEPHEVNVGSEILSSHTLAEFRPLPRTGKRYARIRKAPTSPTAATPYCSLYPPQAALANVPPSPPRAGSSDRIRGAAVASIPLLCRGIREGQALREKAEMRAVRGQTVTLCAGRGGTGRKQCAPEIGIMSICFGFLGESAALRRFSPTNIVGKIRIKIRDLYCNPRLNVLYFNPAKK